MSVDIEPDSEWRPVVAAIRKVHPTVPVVVFGGHHHVSLCLSTLLPFPYSPATDCPDAKGMSLDVLRHDPAGLGMQQVRQCARYDEYSMGLAAGRYMETIGFMSELRPGLFDHP